MKQHFGQSELLLQCCMLPNAGSRAKGETWERTPANEALGRREAEEVVKTLCGTQRVYAFDHTWREQPPFGPQTHIQIAYIAS